MSRLRAFDVVHHLKKGTVIVGVNFRSVIIVIEGGDLLNPFNGTVDHWHAWYTANQEVELFEDLEDWIQADMPMEIDKDEDDLIKEIGPQ